MARAIHIEEFLWRGRPAGSDQPAAWHIRLMATGGVDDFNAPIPAVVSDPMTPEQAAAAGFPLPVILAAINTEALAQVANLQGALAALQKTLDDERAASAAQVMALQGQAEAAEKAREQLAASTAAVIADLNARLDELRDRPAIAA
ncbi:hypothetical protein ACLBYG_22510 [Methylobacterium sp. D53M]